jgi:outer membrane protein assembly factor BamB
MVRVRLGSSWKQDPELRSALARGGAEARQAAACAVDALALEVDGVDVGAGLAEGALVAGVEALGAAVLRLLGGAARAQVHFSEGGVELALARRGTSALLTVVSLGRPARVLAQDVEVDLADLARATREAASALADDLAALQPGAARDTTRSLRALDERLAVARAAPAEALPSPARVPAHGPHLRADAPACAFEIQDEEGLLASYRGPGADLGSLLPAGLVVLRALDGREVALSGPPFLVLRDLAAFAAQLADAVQRGDPTASVTLAAPGRHATTRLEADLRNGTLVRDDGAPLPCPPLPLARALLEAAVDFCGVAAARNAWQANNGWLAELRTGAAERLAHVNELLAGDVLADTPAAVRTRRARRRLPGAPLGPGRMRRLTFRRAWEIEVGPPAGIGLAVHGDAIVAAGAATVVAIDARTGAERWRQPGAAFAAAGEGALYLADVERLACVDAATGRQRWARATDELPEGLGEVVRLAGGVALAVGPGAAVALDPLSGRTLWRFAPPAARALRVGALGQLGVAGGDAGLLYGLDAATGQTAWRLRLPGPLVAAPTSYGDACFALCTTTLGGSLLALDPATGRRLFEVPLDVQPTAAPVPFAGLLAVAGLVAGDPVVVAVEPSGRLAWEDAPPLGAGQVALAAIPSGLLAKTAGGACVALARDGTTSWSRSRAALHPPPSNAPPVVARAVALVPGEQVAALDVSTGDVLGHAPIAAPARLLADAELNAWGMDAAGVVTAVRLERRLSVV